MRFGLLVTEALRSLRASLSTTLAATVTVVIGMFLLGLAVALLSWVDSYSDHVKRQLVVNVYFCTSTTCDKEVTPQQINNVRAKLEANPLVKEVQFVPKAEAFEIMQKREPELVEGVVGNPFPDAEKVIPHRAEDVKKIAQSLQPPPPGVEKD